MPFAAEPLESRVLLASVPFEAHVNFQPAKVAPADGYAVEGGGVFADRGEGLSYGWSARNAGSTKRRNSPLSSDPRYDQLAAFGKKSWEIEVPAGNYAVHVAAGDPRAARGLMRVHVEGVRAIEFVANKEQRWAEGTIVVAVADGRLTLDGGGARASKINYVDVFATDAPAAIADGGGAAWRTVAPAPVARVEASRAVVGGKLYVFGGYDEFNLEATDRTDVYDPATDTWATVADAPVGQTHGATAVDGETIWVVGAFLGDGRPPTTPDVFKYDAAADVWSRGPSLPEPSGAGALAIVGRRLHYVGGLREDRDSDAVEHFTLDLDAGESAAWAEAAPLPKARNHLAGVALDGKMYVIGGQQVEDEFHANQSAVDVYDPTTDTWTSAAPLPGGRGHINASSFVLNGKIVVIGGEANGGRYLSTVSTYDPATNRWTDLSSLPAPRKSPVADVIGGRVIVVGGQENGRRPQANQTWVGTPLV